MCGRFILTSPVESLAKIFGFSERPNLAPRYNIAPTQPVAAVRTGEEGGRHLAVLHWGLVPFWAKETSIGARMINARAETVAEKPAFRAAFRHRRCLIPANGFYEWQRAADGGKQPYLIRRPDGAPFAFAGLWESWESKETGEVLESCSILTTDANRTLEPIHHRMPVILDRAGAQTWLAPGSERGKELQALLKPAPDDLLEAFPVSRAVNKVANDSEALLETVTLPEEKREETQDKPARQAAPDDTARIKKQGELF